MATTNPATSRTRNGSRDNLPATAAADAGRPVIRRPV